MLLVLLLELLQALLLLLATAVVRVLLRPVLLQGSSRLTCVRRAAGELLLLSCLQEVPLCCADLPLCWPCCCYVCWRCGRCIAATPAAATVGAGACAG